MKNTAQKARDAAICGATPPYEVVMRLRCLSFCLLLLSLLGFTAIPAWCGESTERYIKVLGVDAENLHLEVDGRNMDIPLPDGYEPMPPDEYPNTYGHFIAETQKSESIPLCALVYSVDDERSKRDPSFQVNRIAFFEVYHDNISKRFTRDDFKQEIKNIKIINTDTIRWVNEQLQYRGRNGFMGKYIYEDDNVLSLVRVEFDTPDDRDYRIGLSRTELLIEDIAILVRFYENIYTESDMDSLTNTTTVYIEKLGKR